MQSIPQAAQIAPHKRGVYLIHFERPYKHARHYMGYADDIHNRLVAHGEGRGARLMEVIRDAGIPWRLARVWEGKGRVWERKLKNRKHAPALCPVCNPDHAFCCGEVFTTPKPVSEEMPF